MVKVLEAVPNVSEGRDRSKIDRLAGLVAACDVDLLDRSSDPDHHRSVLTFIGEPSDVEHAALVVARFALEHIDLRNHQGVHPRVGALDVMPFVPLEGAVMADAVESARRVAGEVARLGVPVYLYGHASDPPGRALAEVRRGGFEGLVEGFPADRMPDFPAGLDAAHPSAGATCVGARDVLLAWNVFVEGIDVRDAKDIAAALRERGGGFPGLRALGLRLEGEGRIQISMNLEDMRRTSPIEVFEEIERKVRSKGGSVEETEVIGMIPDALVLPAAGNRLHLPDLGSARVLSRRVSDHVVRRLSGNTETSDSTE